MQTKRDNLVLIGAFAAAVVLHAVILPWVGAAIGSVETETTPDWAITKLSTNQFAKTGDIIDISFRFDELNGVFTVADLPLNREARLVLSRQISIDENAIEVERFSWGGWNIDLFDAEGNKDLKQNLLEGRFEIPAYVDGIYWLILEDDPDQLLPDADRSNNTRIAPIYIDGPQRPELAIQTFNTPERAAAGGSILIDFAVANLGDGWASSNPQLGEHGWADRIYLSADEQLDANDLPLRTFDRTAPLGPEGEYRHDVVELELPRGVTGPMHLILAADADQLLDQPSFTRGFAVCPIELIDTNEPDLIVATITNPDRLVIGRPAPVTFSIANIGSVPTVNSDWIDGVFLSSDEYLDDNDLVIRTANAGQPLQPRSRYESAVELALAESVEPGDWYLIVKADRENNVSEAAFDDNNTFAVPIEVWTQAQADAEITLGDPDRPERLVVQWIENDRLKEHIARRSRTVQPALQSQAEPDPLAPLVDNPKPPALAAVDSATGNPIRPTQPTDPTNPNTNQPPPDATATDVAPRPQTDSSPTQSKLDGLPGDDGTLPPKRDGTDGPITPNQPLDPTPATQDTPTKEPGDREVPSPADPTAPDTDTKTDSETPAETESDTDSKNPEEIDSDTKTEDQTTDTTTTPKPDTEDAPTPEGDDGDPATPSEEQTPTRAPKDDSEAPPTDIKITELELQEGKVLVGKGIKVTTKLPTRPGTGSRILSIPRNARVSITFDNKGKVFEAKVIRTTTYAEWDAAIEASLYRWTARGEAIDNAKPHITIEWDYLLNDLFDEDE